MIYILKKHTIKIKYNNKLENNSSLNKKISLSSAIE